jgi:hypothetical protein
MLAVDDVRGRFRTDVLHAAEDVNLHTVGIDQRRVGHDAEHLAREHGRLAWRAFELALSDEDALRRVPGGPLINVSSS